MTLLTLGVSACVTVGSTEQHDRNVITEAEIQTTNAHNAYDLISALRSGYLRSRGPNSILIKTPSQPSVFLDNVEYGTVSSLHNIEAATIAEIRFFEGWDAMTKYGSNHVAGVIQIYTRYQ
ncbi:MAG: hypothetical protein H0W63_10235 [Gemmatimonadaceae bacterium]|nr:hypothetical protein [Gemmatimonadaceae bacterium]